VPRTSIPHLLLFGWLTTACSFRGGAKCEDRTTSCVTDGMPADSSIDAAPCVPWPYAPSNIAGCDDPGANPPLTLAGGDFVLTPQTGGVTKDGAPFTTLVTTGSSPRIVSLAGLVIEATATLSIAGPDPTILVVHGAATIDGVITVSARGAASGGGAAACAGMVGTNADSAIAKSAGGGGGGGAFGSRGAAGGTGDVSPSATPTPGGPEMPPEGLATLVPLRGGCRGAAGGEEHATAMATPGIGGGGGGAFQLSVRDALAIGVDAQLMSNGGGGRGAVNIANGPDTHAGAGGGGGGAGGGIFVEAHTMTIDTSAILCANGGGGGGGSHDMTDGEDGDDGECASTSATGGAGVTGGDGAFGATSATQGANGGGGDGGGGGGGGGGGRIRVRAATGMTPGGFISTPPALID